MQNGYICEIKGIEKSFPGVNALQDVSFNITKGHVHALVGENGAGKSTLIKVLAGVYDCNKGEIFFDGEKVNFKAPYEAQASGINVVHQELKLVPSLSVAENIFLGKPFMKKITGLPRVDWKRIYTEAQILVNSLGMDLDVRQTVEKLSVAKKQIVEICKAISNKCKLIIMDEPSATLTDKELQILFDVIRKLRQDGVTIIYISHRLEEIFEIADCVTVLRDGKHITTCDVCDVDKKKLISMMVGRELAEEYPKEFSTIGETVLEVNNLSRKGILKNISFKLRKGEVLGIAGLVGSGRTELARAILGIDAIDSGEIIIKGEKRKINRITDAIKLKMALVPEDRRGQGLIQGMKVRENITIVGIDKIIKRKVLRNKKENDIAKQYVKMLSIATPTIDTEVRYLSGGNQQKVVLAKWLLVKPDIIILDEPTRGVDVGAKAEIYKILNSLTNAGMAVIMISSEMPEIIGMADRVIVMHDGEITGELDRSEANQEAIMSYCIS